MLLLIIGLIFAVERRLQRTLFGVQNPELRIGKFDLKKAETSMYRMVQSMFDILHRFRRDCRV